MSPYLRSKNGRVVHRPDCKRRGAAIVWGWPEAMGVSTDAELREAIKPYPWLRLCAHCLVAEATR